jgi:hypothetical protein
VRAPALWGFVFGGIQAASPLAFWWLDAATVYALGLALIASVCIGFAVVDGRWVVIAFETNVAAVFVVAAAAVTGSPCCSSSALRATGSRIFGSTEVSCREHPLVAPVLPSSRLGRRHDHRRRDRRGR